MLFVPAIGYTQNWQPLFNGRDLNGWQVRGESVWAVLPGGVLLGKRMRPDPEDPFGHWPLSLKEYRSWLHTQSWLYTIREFGEFDLHVEYLVPHNGNSGVSIRDPSRAHYVIGESESKNPSSTTALRGSPAHIGYEIQIVDGETDRYHSGSIYLFVAAKSGVQKPNDWNNLDIESRNDVIRVRLNATITAEHPGDPARSKKGPIGLQLHDQFSFMMFRNIRIRPVVTNSLKRGVTP